MLSTGILQRVNRQTLTQHWRWLAVSAVSVFTLTIFLLGHDRTGPPPKNYQELLLSTSNANNCSNAIVIAGSSRLARTLQDSERRYEHMLVERDKIIIKSGGYGINAFGPKHVLANLLWDYFIPAFSCPFPMYRVGSIAEGGKWLCGVERVLHHRPNCLVYSLNHRTPSSSYSSFEKDMLERSPGCQIHVFSPNSTTKSRSHWPFGDTSHTESELLKPRVHFNQFALADPNADRYRSLRSVMHTFKHDWIDVVQMDLAGAEFATLLSIIDDYQDEPLPFGQLVLTVNVGVSDDMRKVSQFSEWWTRLECAGLRPYYFEVSMKDVNNRRLEPSIVYWSFMNLRGRHALLDDRLPDYP
ncbi:Methyltranfer-dom domain-containing protein [Favolaschia claudopus]|uniref:Methyltranfer-dom domain-containing protein n=1 Tax=Favolaschia claudopus TaxID=2862362 RepID=A0AAW0CK13_9AGAR